MGMAAGMTDPTPETDPAAEDTALEDKQRLLDKFRGTGVGVEDPNIVGDAGPTDVAPGDDPPADDASPEPPLG